MAIVLLPRSFISHALTPDQRWALKFTNTLNLVAFVSIVATGVSIVGFGLTSDHGLPEDQKNDKVKKVAHYFFTCTLILGASATVVAFMGMAYTVYVYNKI